LNRWLNRGACVVLLLSASFSRDTVQTTPPSPPAPILKITPAALTFLAQAVGTPAAPQTITLTDSGSANLQVNDIFVSGIDFDQSNTCGPSVAAGASCTIAVTFKPAIPGLRLGTMSIVTSDPASPRLVPLTGTGE
jgi:hypothetical protein